jgi:hypothetical protein
VSFAAKTTTGMGNFVLQIAERIFPSTNTGPLVCAAFAKGEYYTEKETCPNTPIVVRPVRVGIWEQGLGGERRAILVVAKARLSPQGLCTTLAEFLHTTNLPKRIIMPTRPQPTPVFRNCLN